MQTWQVGNFKITKVHELPIEVGLLDGLIPELTPEAVREIDWLYPDYVNESGQILADLHSFVIDNGEHVILTDAGCGNGKSYPMQPIWSDLDTPFLERLQEAGYGRDDIDIILCTHAHLDHVGWFSMRDEEGKWVPTFPNARLVMVRDEYERHLSQIVETGEVQDVSDAAGDDDVDLIARAFHPDTSALSNQTRLIQEESFQPIVDAGRLELVPTDGQVVPGVRYESTPGHTTAHHSIRLDSDGATAFVTGDAFHHPIQIARPDWSSQGDWDGGASARSRRAVLESCAGTDLLFMGTHFAGITAGYIVEDGEGFRLVESRPPSVERR
ncbi:MBL fold metallo-hydrolase [Acrocarpospora pleiomorpha]|uniref:MBL fold metallo-hydrolase n=1 Tax=Acrocarpospora pleiomorpha TaxID=90975 RepID=A0A5M3XHI1_9ACTN|nr:MBL fold metallo-hydrolase [Acrocarpospora pleiomorpha]GES19669.1 MBL fold metallo-hydrolase [Acrocarpospora pleiomorpha]